MKRLQFFLLGSTALMMVAACEPFPPSAQEEGQAFLAALETPTIPSDISRGGGISLNNFARILAASDEAVRAQALDVEIARQTAASAGGALEPELYFSINRRSETRQTSAEQLRASAVGSQGTGRPNPYWSRTTDSRLGIEVNDRFGANYDLYYEIDRVANSLQTPAALPQPEFSSAIGASITVPLLRNAGEEFNNSSVEIAEIDQDIAIETTRLVKADRAFEGVQAYILLQRAKERIGVRTESLRLTQSLARQISSQVDAGLRDASELTSAQARVGEQRAALVEAQQILNDQVGAFQVFFTALEGGSAQTWTTAESLSIPSSAYLNRGNFSNVEQAFARRPESRIYALRIEREEVLRLVAENQALSEFNLRADVSKTSLSDAYVPFRSVFSTNNPYQTWRVGFEYRRGLGGDVQERAEFRAALLREQQAELTMQAYQQRIRSELQNIGSIVDRARQQVREQQRIVTSNRSLLQTENNRSADGGSSAIETLTRELELVAAREAYGDAVAQLNLSSYLASHVSGKLLNRLGIE